MSYTLNHTNGTLLTTVADGSIDNTTDLTFVGKNYSGYGSIVNQDLVKLLENFAGAVPPTKPLAGELWYDSGNKKIKFYTGVNYKQVTNIYSQNTFPTDMTDGDLFWNISEQRLYIYDASYSTWRIVGPQFTPAQQVNSVIYANVYDSNGFSHNILKYQMVDINNNTIVTAISSPDPDFTLGASNPITGFTLIKQGLTLNGTDDTGKGSTFTTWGTVSNATKLNGQPSSSYVTVATPVVTGQFTITNNLGISINSVTALYNNASSTLLTNLVTGGKITVSSLKDTQVYDIANFGFQGTENRAAIMPTIIPGQSTDIGAIGTNNQFAYGYINTLTSINVNSGNVTVQNVYANNLNDQETTIGTSVNPFDTVYAYNVYAIDSISGPILAGTSAPTRSSSTGTIGSVAYDENYIYVCVANNTWRRTALSTF
jgi:hypothetical protein